MIGYLGPSGTFSHTAAGECFPDMPLKEYATIYSLILAVDSGELETAVVPIENSIEGSVNITLDTLAIDADVHIVGEYILKVCENLIVQHGTKKENITKIVSHPQPIGQCSRILNRMFGNVEIQFTESTAAAARLVTESGGEVAMIGPKSCAELYGLEILIPNCGDEQNNSTRFVIIEKNPCTVVTSEDKSSIAFSLNNTPGSLYNALELFYTYNINMIKIESRPLKKELGKYIFFIDIDGNTDNASIYFALDKLRRSTGLYKFLGSYKKAQLS